MTLVQMRRALAGKPWFPPEGQPRDANGAALIYPGPDGRTSYRNGYPLGIHGQTNPEACDGTCRANCSICKPEARA